MGRRRQPPPVTLTPLELELMEVLWQQGEASVQQVQERLQPRRPLAYTTIQTVLNVLTRKGRARRRREGRAFVYRPAVSRDSAVRRAVDDLLNRLFDGSAQRLVLNLVEERRLTPEELEELRRLVEEQSNASREEP